MFNLKKRVFGQNGVFGLNRANLTSVAYNPKGFDDTECIDLTYTVGEKDYYSRLIPPNHTTIDWDANLTYAQIKNPTEKHKKDYAKKVKNFVSYLAEIALCYVTEEELDAFNEKTASITKLEKYVKEFVALIAGYEKKDVALFLQYEKKAKQGTNKKWLRAATPRDTYGVNVSAYVDPQAAPVVEGVNGEGSQDSDWVMVTDELVGITFIDGAGNVHPIKKPASFLTTGYATNTVASQAGVTTKNVSEDEDAIENDDLPF